MSDHHDDFSSLGEMGFPFTPSGKEDWLYIGNFAPTIRDQSDLRGIGRSLYREYGKGVFEIIKLEDESGRLVRAHLIIAPDDCVEESVREMLARIEAHEHVDDEVFWEIVNPIIQDQWAGTSLLDRLDLVEEAGGMGPGHALDATVPDDVHTIIYRGLDVD